jgi:hypothetical protein
MNRQQQQLAKRLKMLTVASWKILVAKLCILLSSDVFECMGRRVLY